MQCPQCQADVMDEASFCSRCGARISPDDPAEAQAAAAPQETLAAKPNAGRNDPELDLWKATYSPKAAIPAFVVAGLVSVAAIVLFVWMDWFGAAWRWLFLGILVVFAGLAIQLWLTRMSTAYRLTSQRLVHEAGLLRRVTNRLEVIDIDDVTTEQGLIDRFLGIGRIKLTSSDRTHPVLVLRGVDDVRNVADKIDHARRTERIRRGLHIEAV